MLDQAFAALKTFDFGTPLTEVWAIEDAVVASHANTELRKDLEQRLVAVLETDISNDAKGYVCRKLAVIGSMAAVQSLAALLASEANAHLARQALERIPGSEAAAALQDALPKLTGKLKIGVIGSLGARREVGAVPTLAGLLNDSEPAIARAATLALGTIGRSESARALQNAINANQGDRRTLIDSLLSCAESLLSIQKHDEAATIYKTLAGEQQPRLVRLAATRGLLACSSQQT